MEFHAITESKGSSPLTTVEIAATLPTVSLAVSGIIADGMQFAADLHERIQTDGQSAVQQITDNDSPVHPSLSKVRSAYLKMKSNIEALGQNHPYERSLKFFLKDIVELSTAPLGEIGTTMAKIRTTVDNLLQTSSEKIPPPFHNSGLVCMKKVPDDAPSNVISKERLEEMQKFYADIEAGETSIVIDGDDIFKSQVLTIIALSLTYPNAFKILKMLASAEKDFHIKRGEESQYNFGTHVMNYNPSSDMTYLANYNGKRVTSKFSITSIFVHECIHATHSLDGQKDANKYFATHPNFEAEEAAMWTNIEEVVTIGKPEINSPFTENTYKGERNTYLSRDTHHALPHFSQDVTPILKLKKITSERVDGEIEFLLIDHPELVNEMTEVFFQTVHSLAETKGNSNLLRLLETREHQQITQEIISKNYLNTLYAGVKPLLITHPELLGTVDKITFDLLYSLAKEKGDRGLSELLAAREHKPITPEILEKEFKAAIQSRNIPTIVAILIRHDSQVTRTLYNELAQRKLYDTEGIILTYLLNKTEFHDILSVSEAWSFVYTAGGNFHHLINDSSKLLLTMMCKEGNTRGMNLDAKKLYEDAKDPLHALIKDTDLGLFQLQNGFNEILAKAMNM